MEAIRRSNMQQELLPYQRAMRAQCVSSSSCMPQAFAIRLYVWNATDKGCLGNFVVLPAKLGQCMWPLFVGQCFASCGAGACGGELTGVHGERLGSFGEFVQYMATELVRLQKLDKSLPSSSHAEDNQKVLHRSRTSASSLPSEVEKMAGFVHILCLPKGLHVLEALQTSSSSSTSALSVLPAALQHVLKIQQNRLDLSKTLQSGADASPSMQIEEVGTKTTTKNNSKIRDKDDVVILTTSNASLISRNGAQAVLHGGKDSDVRGLDDNDEDDEVEKPFTEKAMTPGGIPVSRQNFKKLLAPIEIHEEIASAKRALFDRVSPGDAYVSPAYLSHVDRIRQMIANPSATVRAMEKDSQPLRPASSNGLGYDDDEGSSGVESSRYHHPLVKFDFQRATHRRRVATGGISKSMSISQRQQDDDEDASTHLADLSPVRHEDLSRNGSPRPTATHSNDKASAAPSPALVLMPSQRRGAPPQLSESQLGRSSRNAAAAPFSSGAQQQLSPRPSSTQASPSSPPSPPASFIKRLVQDIAFPLGMVTNRQGEYVKIDGGMLVPGTLVLSTITGELYKLEWNDVGRGVAHCRRVIRATDPLLRHFVTVSEDTLQHAVTLSQHFIKYQHHWMTMMRLSRVIDNRRRAGESPAIRPALPAVNKGAALDDSVLAFGEAFGTDPASMFAAHKHYDSPTQRKKIQRHGMDATFARDDDDDDDRGAGRSVDSPFGSGTQLSGTSRSFAPAAQHLNKSSTTFGAKVDDDDLYPFMDENEVDRAKDFEALFGWKASADRIFNSILRDCPRACVSSKVCFVTDICVDIASSALRPTTTFRFLMWLNLPVVLDLQSLLVRFQCRTDKGSREAETLLQKLDSSLDEFSQVCSRDLFQDQKKQQQQPPQVPETQLPTSSKPIVFCESCFGHEQQMPSDEVFALELLDRQSVEREAHHHHAAASVVKGTDAAELASGVCFSGTDLMQTSERDHPVQMISVAERCYVCRAENSERKVLPQRPAHGITNGSSLSEALLVF